MGRFEEKLPRKIHTTFQIKERVTKIGEQNGTFFKGLKKTWRFKKNKRLSFISRFKIEFLLPFTGCRKVFEKMPV